VPKPKGLGVLAPRLNPPHAEKALSKQILISDRLLESTPPRRWFRAAMHMVKKLKRQAAWAVSAFGVASPLVVR
jgi:hypothetical protein